MKKLLGVIAGFALAITTIATIAVVSGVNDPAQAASCTNGTKYTDFDGSHNGRDTMTVWTKGNKKLCKDVKVNFTNFRVDNKNYNGKPFKNNPTALPQTSIFNKTVTLKKGTTGKTTVKVALPNACTPYQMDAYIGPVQTKITTSKGLVNTTAIVGKLINKTKTDCSVPPVLACNTVTGVIEKVAKGKENTAPYTTDLEECEKIEACNTTTGEIEEVLPGKADTPPYTTDLEKCDEPEMVEACNTTTGVIEEVEAGKENVAPYTTDLTKCDEPELVDACNTTTGIIEKVEKGKENTAPYTTDLTKCDDVEVCDEDTGKIITVPKADEDKYGPVDSKECKEEPVTPEELPTTGPAEALSALVGIGAVAGTTTSYVRSRLALRK